MTKPVLPRSGAPISELVNDKTRQQLETLRDQLAKSEAMERPREANGQFTPVSRDTLVRDNRSIQRMKDLAQVASEMTVGQLLDTARVPSVTQLTRRYSTQASRAPLIGLLAGRGLGPTDAAVLGTTPRLGTGGALVVWQPKPMVPVSTAAPIAPPIDTGPRRLEDQRVSGAGQSQQSAGADGAQSTQSKPSWWQSLKQFGQTVMEKTGLGKVWDNLKTHPLVAPVLAFFVGKGFGPAHASAHGANPPKQPTYGAPLREDDVPAPAPDVIHLPADAVRIVDAAVVDPPQARLTGPAPVPRLTLQEPELAVVEPPQARLTGPAPVPRLTFQEPEPAVVEPPQARLTGSAPVPRLTFQEPELAIVTPTAETLGLAVEQLGAAWPRGVDTEPAAFTKQAAQLQAFKLQRLETLGDTPKVRDVRAFLSECDAMHGKTGHSRNVSKLADLFLRDTEILGALQQADDWTPQTADQVASAAPWLNLGDAQAPVGVLAAPRRPDKAEFEAYIAPRGEMAAALYQQLGLGGPRSASLIAGYRATGERPIASQLIRLLDDTAALAAKPFCRKDDQVDVDTLASKLRENAERGAFDAGLADLMITAAKQGLVDQALTSARAEDLYVH